MIKVTYLLHIIWTVFYLFSLLLYLIDFHIEDLIIQGAITLYLPVLGKSSYEKEIDKFTKNCFDIFLTSMFYGLCIGFMALNDQYLIYFLFMFIFTLTYSSTLIISFSDFTVEYVNNLSRQFYTLMMIDFVNTVYLVAILVTGFTKMNYYYILLLMSCVQVQLIMSIFTPNRLVSRVNNEVIVDDLENDRVTLFIALFASYLFLTPVIVLYFLKGEYLIIKINLYILLSLLLYKTYIFIQINKSKTIHPVPNTELNNISMIVSLDTIQVGVPMKK